MLHSRCGRLSHNANRGRREGTSRHAPVAPGRLVVNVVGLSGTELCLLEYAHVPFMGRPKRKAPKPYVCFTQGEIWRGSFCQICSKRHRILKITSYPLRKSGPMVHGDPRGNTRSRSHVLRGSHSRPRFEPGHLCEPDERLGTS